MVSLTIILQPHERIERNAARAGEEQRQGHGAQGEFEFPADSLPPGERRLHHADAGLNDRNSHVNHVPHRENARPETKDEEHCADRLQQGDDPGEEGGQRHPICFKKPPKPAGPFIGELGLSLGQP